MTKNEFNNQAGTKAKEEKGIRYFQTPYSLLDEERLRKQNKADTTLALLGDRMRLSRKNGSKYYDEQEQDYFIRFSQSTMAKFINASPRTVYTIYKHLDDNKYIRRKHVGYNRPDNIFLTHYAQRLLPGLEVIAKSGSQNQRPSNSERNHRDVSHRGSGSSNGSVNSEQSHDESSKNESQDKETKSKNDDINSSHEKSDGHVDAKGSLNQRVQNWRDKVHQSLGLSTNVLMSILNVTKMNTNLSGMVINWIRNARVHVTKKNRISFQDKRAKFEFNQNFDGPLADKIKYIFNSIHKKKKEMSYDDCGRYVTACLKEFFYDALGLKSRDQVCPKMAGEDSNDTDTGEGHNTDIAGYEEHKVQNGPKIPIFQIK